MELLNNKTILVTGGAGFIGSHVVELFLKKGWHVICAVHKNIPQKLKNLNNLEIIHLDVTNPKTLENLHFPYIAHVAGLASDIGPDSLFRKLNFESVKNLAKCAEKRFIYVSSSDVYGIKDFHGETEKELPLLEYPHNPYPKYKIMSENWLKENLESSKYSIIRPAAVYGEGDLTLEKRVIDFLKTSPYIVHFGKWRGKNRWPLCNVENVAKLIYACAVKDKYGGEAFTVIDSKKTTIDEFYRDIAIKYFPDKKYKTIYFPLWFGKLLGIISSSISNILKLKHPIFDPSFYAVHHVSSNLDLSAEKMTEAIESTDNI